MASEYRNSLFQLLFKNETITGVASTATFPDNWQYIGLHSTINLPDPIYGWVPVYGIGANARPDNARSWAVMQYGKQEFSGSFANMILVTGHVLPFILGQENATDGGTYIQHDIREALTLPTFTLDGRFYNVDRTYPDLIRRWMGCKVDVAHIFCDQRGYLSLSLEKIVALDMAHNVSAVASTDSQRRYLKWDLSLTEVTPLDYPFSGERDPYLFSGGEIQLLDGGSLNSPSGNLTIRNISRFSVVISHNLTPKYYDTRSNTDSTQTPYEYLEGRREYAVSITADIMGQDVYKWLVAQGRQGVEKTGYGIRAIFTKRPSILANNYLEIRIPGDTNTHTWNTINSVTPVAGEETANYHPGAFAISAPHSVTEDARLRVNIEFNAPSLSFLIRDKWGAYLN